MFDKEEEEKRDNEEEKSDKEEKEDKDDDGEESSDDYSSEEAIIKNKEYDHYDFEYSNCYITKGKVSKDGLIFDFDDDNLTANVFPAIDTENAIDPHFIHLPSEKFIVTKIIFENSSKVKTLAFSEDSEVKIIIFKDNPKKIRKITLSLSVEQISF